MTASHCTPPMTARLMSPKVHDRLWKVASRVKSSE